MRLIYQSEIAKSLGVARCVVCNWLGGKYRPSLKYLPKLQELGFTDLEMWGDKEKIHKFLWENDMENLLLPKNSKKRPKIKRTINV